MAIFITGDTHGDFSRLLPAAFHEQRDLTKEDYHLISERYGLRQGSNEMARLSQGHTTSGTTLRVPI